MSLGGESNVEMTIIRWFIGEMQCSRENNDIIHMPFRSKLMVSKLACELSLEYAFISIPAASMSGFGCIIVAISRIVLFSLKTWICSA